MPKPLIIGVDVRDLRLARTGTRTYLEELVKEFKKMNGNGVQFHFLDTDFPVYTGNKKLFKLIEHARYQLWKQLILPIKAFSKNCAVVFCTDNFVPLIHLGYKTIPVFHDAFFFENPENYGRLWLWLYKRTAIPAAKRSPFIVTPTQYAKDQIARYNGITEKKLVVIYEGPKSLEDRGSQSNINSIPLDCPYLLHVGTLFKRKNIPALINAFKQIKASGYPELKLVLAGSFPANSQESDQSLIIDTIENSGLRDQVMLTGYLSDGELALLYKNALMYVFPSINEGFGIPILEAFKYNLPVLVANNTSLPEVGGDAVLQFNPFDIADMSQKIKSVLDDPNLRTEMAEKGQQRLAGFSWQKAALELIEVFRKVV
jgi:glycosyltransferase involved in cell wall biosynthesis